MCVCVSLSLSIHIHIYIYIYTYIHIHINTYTHCLVALVVCVSVERNNMLLSFVSCGAAVGLHQRQDRLQLHLLQRVDGAHEDLLGARQVIPTPDFRMFPQVAENAENRGKQRIAWRRNTNIHEAYNLFQIIQTCSCLGSGNWGVGISLVAAGSPASTGGLAPRTSRRL